MEKAGDINLIMFSDHGMTQRLGGPSDASSGLINVLDYINATDWERAVDGEYSTTMQIWPKPDNEDWVSFTLHNGNFNCVVAPHS